MVMEEHVAKSATDQFGDLTYPPHRTAVIQAAQLLVIHPAGLCPPSVNTSTTLSHHSVRSLYCSPQSAYHLAATISGPALHGKPPGRAATPRKMNGAEWRSESAAPLAVAFCASREESGVEVRLAES